eukprot:gb/GFBE01021917.1/.p1 GENE.gb/GFBE01021917.1/~~gb/GFBE01021917.1/.p1  ORF type:complete len:674 (+),score=138.26 gb/GFBE01021917.1/:1-2022(+)
MHAPMKMRVAMRQTLLAACGLAIADAGKTLPAMGIASIAEEKTGMPLTDEAHADLTAPGVGSVAGVLTDLLKSGSGSKDNSAITEELIEILNVTMKGRLHTAHNKSLKAIDNARSEFSTCKTTYQGVGSVALLQSGQAYINYITEPNRPCNDKFEISTHSEYPGTEMEFTSALCQELCTETADCTAATLFIHAGSLCRLFYQCGEQYDEANTTTFKRQTHSDEGFSATATGDSSSEVNSSVAGYFHAYVQCKTWEEELETNLTTCDYHCVQLSTGLREECITNDLSEQCSNLDCAAQSGEAYKAFLQRMVADLSAEILHVSESQPCTGASGTWLNSSGLDHRCQTCSNIEGEVEECYKTCNNIVEKVIPEEEVIPGCCAPRTQAETETCQALYNKRAAYTNYTICYENAMLNWNTVKAEHEAQADVRMAQMRAILRMLCLVDTFTGDQTQKINACIATSWVNHAEVLGMDIDAGEPPAPLDPFTCTASDTPGSAEYDALHYAHLPDGLMACPAVHCEDACGLSNASNDYFATTSPPSAAQPATGRCFSQSGAGGVYWDFGSMQVVGSVAATPSPGTSLKVYLTNAGPGETVDESKLCGTITSAMHAGAVHEVSCAPESAARYLVLKAEITGGSCSFGDCALSWCEMHIDGKPMAEEQKPMEGTGTVYVGAITA